jgi:hypothetical protein
LLLRQIRLELDVVAAIGQRATIIDMTGLG